MHKTIKQFMFIGTQINFHDPYEHEIYIEPSSTEHRPGKARQDDSRWI